ncbi:MAG: Ltp family lipoprotein [Actinomycetota bacterium]|nr:Ltp family lipoprotein [Actinomycetota bacterium]
MQKGRIKKTLRYIAPLIAFIFISSFVLAACSGTQVEPIDSEVKEESVIEETEEEETVEEETEEEEAVEKISKEVVEEPEEEEEDLNTTETSPGETDSATLGEKNAARKALDYLAFMPFSYSGLVKQLEFEGFTHEEAVYGVDRCGADWNEQAALKARDYLASMPFSYSGLVEQLEFEGFTRQQAEYGAQAVGY